MTCTHRYGMASMHALYCILMATFCIAEAFGVSMFVCRGKSDTIVKCFGVE